MQNAVMRLFQKYINFFLSLYDKESNNISFNNNKTITIDGL